MVKKDTALIIGGSGLVVGLLGCYYGYTRRKRERIISGELELDEGRTLRYEERIRFASLRTSRALGGRK